MEEQDKICFLKDGEVWVSVQTEEAIQKKAEDNPITTIYFFASLVDIFDGDFLGANWIYSYEDYKAAKE